MTAKYDQQLKPVRLEQQRVLFEKFYQEAKQNVGFNEDVESATAKALDAAKDLKKKYLDEINLVAEKAQGVLNSDQRASSTPRRIS